MYRGNILFDETGFLSAEMLQTYSAFAVTNKAFKTGKSSDGEYLSKERLMSVPESPPYQKFYLSSASSTDTEFYRIYREFSKKMLLGHPDYFVANFDCSVAFHPTLHGEKISPLLSKDTVDTMMKTDPEKARREYYCEFTSDAGDNAIIRRGDIARNCEIRKPLCFNDTGDKKFVITYDPARLSDNSVILVAEVFENDDKGVESRIVNCINLVDVHKKNRTPQSIPAQVDILRQVILDYNRGGDEFYSNIETIRLDAGAGGQASAIADLLMHDWTDSQGKVHRGLIDKEFAGPDAKMFPNAVPDKLILVSPSKYKSEMVENLIQMIKGDHISFTADYDNKGYLTLIEEDTASYKKERKKIKAQLEAEGVPVSQLENAILDRMKHHDNVTVKNVKLSPEEEAALVNIDLIKDETVNITRIKRETGKDGFELVPEKAHTMHDDHFYVLAMLGHVVAEMRKADTRNKMRNVSRDVADELFSVTKRATRNFKSIG